jgi:hypothetical protein
MYGGQSWRVRGHGDPLWRHIYHAPLFLDLVLPR